MKTTTVLLAFAALLLSCTACATGVQFLDGSGKHTGLVHYAPVPCLLVEHGESAGTLVAKLVSVPDTSKPLYAKYDTLGWGSSKFSLTLVNGIVTEVNGEVDPKATEMIDAVGGLLEKVAGVAAAGLVGPGGTPVVTTLKPGLYRIDLAAGTLTAMIIQ